MMYEQFFLASTFWASLFLIVYTYFLYPMVLFLAYSVLQARRDFYYLNGRRNRRISAVPPEELPKVSIIIPAYNEECRLPATLARIQEYLSTKPWRWEIVVADNGSTDGTPDVVRRYRAAHPRIRLVDAGARPVARETMTLVSDRVGFLPARRD